MTDDDKSKTKGTGAKGRPLPLWATEGDERWGTASGLRWLIRRNTWGFTLNGYVELPAGHRYWGMGYMDIDAPVHGGLTYAASQRPDGPEPVEEWWVGFDCAHLGDYVPGLERVKYIEGFSAISARPKGYPRDVYRDMKFVTAELISLCAWLQAKTPENPEK